MNLLLPDGREIVFENMDHGDEDFASEQCGHLNISLAYRQLKKVGAPTIRCHIPLAEIPKYRQLRDIDPSHVARLKAQWPAPKLRPVLLGELEPGDLTLIDGIHRVIACAEMEPLVDQIQLSAYVIPHDFLPLIRVTVYVINTDGQRQFVDTPAYLSQFWGQYTSAATHGQRSPI